MLEICNYEECTGCAACCNVCGVNAITLKPNIYGYLHPIIDQRLCTNCGACKKVCPNNHFPTFYYPLKSYAGHANNPLEQISSSSGGIASAISRYLLRKGYVIYGCTGKDYLNVHHIRVDKEDLLDYLKGSKYVQSKIGYIFKDIKNDLINRIKVLFIGTPCQVSGLLSYIPQKFQENLITIDFVCHGVPSQQILTQAIEYNISSKRRKKISEIKFRTKNKIRGKSDTYKSNYGMFLYNEDKLIFSKKFPLGSYITAFLNALTYRESCYQCHYAKPERVSDITLGDYKFSNEKYNKLKGSNRILSKIIINTKKGQTLFSELFKNKIIDWQEINFNSLLDNNSQLTQPMNCPENRRKFLKDYPTNGYKCIPKLIFRYQLRCIFNLFLNKLKSVKDKIIK